MMLRMLVPLGASIKASALHAIARIPRGGHYARAYAQESLRTQTVSHAMEP